MNISVRISRKTGNVFLRINREYYSVKRIRDEFFPNGKLRDIDTALKNLTKNTNRKPFFIKKDKLISLI